jgi:predicted CXXCH cytochrome family protein
MRSLLLRVSLFLFFVLLTIVTDQEVYAVGLANDDCIKCHTQEVSLILDKGMKHRSEVSCLDCHETHPPEGGSAISACGLCHATSDRSHFALKSCNECHNPHSPLDIDFAKTDSVALVCIGCHDSVGDQLTDFPSMHSDLDCTECHSRHDSWQSCLDCHTAHTEEMDYDVCLRCHTPHAPRVVKYNADVPNAWCSGCHGAVVSQLAANPSKHQTLRCVYCHKDQHMMTPSCETCHGQPHASIMHKKFPNCRECHIGPHNLDLLS